MPTGTWQRLNIIGQHLKTNNMTDYQTPTDFLNNNPEVKSQWTPQQIGWLYSLGLVRGFKTKKQTLINEDEVRKIFELRIEK